MLNSNYLHKIITESIKYILFEDDEHNNKEVKILGIVYHYDNDTYKEWFTEYFTTMKEAKVSFEKKEKRMNTSSSNRFPLLKGRLNGGIYYVNENYRVVYYMKIVGIEESLNFDGKDIFFKALTYGRRPDLKRKRFTPHVTDNGTTLTRDEISKFKNDRLTLRKNRKELNRILNPNLKKSKKQISTDDEKVERGPSIKGSWDNFRSSPIGMHRVSFPLKPKR